MMTYLFYFIFIVLVVLVENALQTFVCTYMYEDDLIMFIKENQLDDFQKNRYKKSSRVLLLLILVPIVRFNRYFFFMILILAYIEYKRPYLSLKITFKKDLATVRYQFPIWLRQIQILLYTNNVLNALIISQNSAPIIIKKDLETLILSLSDNPNDLYAFSEFMSDYKVSEIERAMKLLFRTYMVEQDDSSKELNRMIVSTTKWIRYERKTMHKDSLGIYEWIGIIPLFGVTLVFLVIMASLLTNLFGKGV